MTAVQLIVGRETRVLNTTRPGATRGPFSLSAQRMPRRQPVADRKYFGLVGKFSHQGKDVRLLIPTTYMNRSGQSRWRRWRDSFRIAPDAILVAHDELDMPLASPSSRPAADGGHNGLRDIIAQLGNQNSFHRLRRHRPSGAQQPGFRLRARPRLERAGTARHQHRLRPRRAAGNARRGLDRAMQKLHSQKA